VNGGHPQAITDDDDDIWAVPAWSPDGKWVAFSNSRDGNDDIHLVRSNGGDVTNLTAGVGSNHDPHWTADGASLRFPATREIPVFFGAGIYELDVATHQIRTVRRFPADLYIVAETSFSPDEQAVALVGVVNGQSDIYVMDLTDGDVRQMTDDAAKEGGVHWHP